MFFTFGQALVNKINAEKWPMRQRNDLYKFWQSIVGQKWQDTMQRYCHNRMKNFSPSSLEEMHVSSISTQSLLGYDFRVVLWESQPLTEQDLYTVFINEDMLYSILSSVTSITEGDVTSLQNEFMAEISEYTDHNLLLDFKQFKGGRKQ